MKGKLALITVALLISSVFAPVVTAGPNGMVGVPDSNVQEDLENPATSPVRAEDLEGSVMASSYASTLEVVVTTPDRASSYVNASTVGSGDVALVFKDDQNHAGRRVAVPADAIREAVGHVPEAVYGVHESGETWTAPVEAESGLLTFEIPKFSSNTVTFTGTVEILGQPATDGSSWTYDVGNPDAVSDLEINVTGATATEWDNETASGLSPSGGTGSIAVGGNMEPVGPGGGEPEVSITGTGETHTDSTNSTATLAYSNGKTVEILFNNPPSEMHDMMVPINWDYSEDSDRWIQADIYLAHGDTTGQDGIQGTQVSDANRANTDEDFTFDAGGFDASGDDTVTVTIDVYMEDNQYEVKVKDADMTAVGKPPTNVTVDTDTGQTADLGSDDVGRLDIQPDTSQLTFTAADGAGTLDYTVSMQERQTTVDPAVQVNQNWTNHTGSLADGETVSLAADTGWIQDGNNTVTVATGSAGADAPNPVVDLQYRHDAENSYSAEYVADGWAEQYNVSHTFVTDMEDPTLTVPFSRTVYEITRLQISTNGGTWMDVPSEDYSIQDTTLTVHLDDGDGDGDVEAGDTLAVRTTGHKFDTVNGAVTVTDPTTADDTGLDPEIRVDSRSSGFHLEIGTTALAPRIHYLHSETWDSPGEYVEVTAGGEQDLYLPNAQAGDTARVDTLPLEVVPESGDASVAVVDPDGPKVEVGPGSVASGDTLTFRYYEITSGEQYNLYSVSRGRTMDTAEAGAEYVALQEDDSEEVLEIRTGSDDSSTSIGAPGSWDTAVQTNSPVANPYAVIGAYGLLLVLVAYGTGKARSISGRTRWALLGTMTVGGGLLSLEVLNPGSISSRIGAGIQEVVPLAGLAGIALVVVSVVYWWRKRQAEASTPETKVSFDLGGGND